MPAFPKTFVVNLDRMPERLTAIRKNFGSYSLDMERVSAVDARQDPDGCMARIDRGSFVSAVRREPLPGEAGCALSHFSIWERFATDPDMPDTVLVLEDDAAPSEHFAHVPDLIEALPEDWEIVLFTAWASWPVWHRRVGNIEVSRCFRPGYYTMGYLVNRRILRHRHRWTARRAISFPIDLWRFWVWRDGMAVYVTTPYLVGSGGVYGSDITPDGNVRKKPPPLGFIWRVRSALFRLRHAPMGAIRAVIAWFRLNHGDLRQPPQ